MKKLFLIGLATLLCASAYGQSETGVNGGKIPSKGVAIGGIGADGKFHFELVDNTGRSNTVTVAKQYTGVPSTFTIGTTDATVFTLAAGEKGFIQNLDDAALAVKYGASASTSSLSFILAAGTAADDGKGGAIVITDWVGVVSVAAMTGSPRYIAWKEAP